MIYNSSYMTSVVCFKTFSAENIEYFKVLPSDHNDRELTTEMYISPWVLSYFLVTVMYISPYYMLPQSPSPQ